MSRTTHRVSRATSAFPRAVVIAGGVALLLASGACGEDNGSGPEGLRFGQVGQATLTLEIPLLGGGMRTEILTWSSEGPFTLVETVSYDGVLGDETVHSEFRNPEQLAGLYATWITQVNESPGAQVVGVADPALDTACIAPPVRITLTIEDAVRDETISWSRCTPFSLGSLKQAGAFPGHEAALVVQAGVFLRDHTVGPEFTSSYLGTVPFATIAKGEDSNAILNNSRTITDSLSWKNFWASHAGASQTPPPVDFDQDIVLIGAVGVRQEAGDSVEIRRIQPSGPGAGSAADVVELVPGNFCAPVARTHVPFHIVRAPRAHVPLPVSYSQPPLLEAVPCGT